MDAHTYKAWLNLHYLHDDSWLCHCFHEKFVSFGRLVLWEHVVGWEKRNSGTMPWSSHFWVMRIHRTIYKWIIHIFCSSVFQESLKWKSCSDCFKQVPQSWGICIALVFFSFLPSNIKFVCLIFIYVLTNGTRGGVRLFKNQQKH